jgi:hypothetical protein
LRLSKLVRRLLLRAAGLVSVPRVHHPAIMKLPFCPPATAPNCTQPAADNPVDAAAHFLADFHQLSFGDLRPHLYTLPQDNAVRHAFRVASGLDSMVLGEHRFLVR